MLIRRLLIIPAVMLASAAFGQQGSWTSLVKIESGRLFDWTGLHPALLFADNATNISTPDHQIILGETYFRKNAETMDPDQFLFVLRYIVSHELGHQIQFNTYGAGMVQASCELKRLYECQADILSGMLLGRMYDLSDTMAETRDFRIITRGLAYIYDNGDDEDGLALHPTPMQRRAAFRYGLGYRPANLNRLLIEERPSCLPRTADSVAWSLEIAKLIMHYPLVNTQSILRTDASIDWDTSVRRPFTVISEDYVNTGSKPLRMTILYQVSGSPSYHNRQWKDTNFFQPLLSGPTVCASAILQPGEKHTFEARLNWRTVSTTRYFPYAILPNAEEALFNATDIGGETVLDQGRDKCLGNFAGLDSENRSGRDDTTFRIDLGNAMNTLIEGDWAALEAGFGEDLFNDKLITYRSTLKFPFSTGTTLFINKGVRSGIEGWLSIDFYDDRDVGYAYQKYDKIAGLLQEHFGQNISWDTVGENEDTKKGLLGTYKNAIIVDLALRVRQDTCSLNLLLSRKRRILPRYSPPITGQEGVTDTWLQSLISGTYDSTVSLPSFVYYKESSNERGFFLCKNADPGATIRKCDTIESRIEKLLAGRGITDSVSLVQIKDSAHEYKIYYAGNHNPYHPNVVLRVFFPDTSMKYAFISLDFYPVPKPTDTY
ncbi:hypothetical protein [Dinghuibacter silviterrae]|uniref:Metalloprotease n=1 Tax=Dinghuibacter silviterrae TaxID=1539049 RepID=A0A4R8DSR8_9BACT|nr:hypothetical protein [Dinghuibacter silviterrae]TDX00201.1 hypothetical protein EDB95_1219 [Dinghuibacter silviterrae]